MEENKMSINLLIEAVKEKDIEIIELIIKRGVDVNALVTHVGRHRRTDKNPLHWASEYGHTEIVKVLLEAGAEVNTPDTLYDEDDPYNDRTSLHYAAYFGHKNVAKLLIDNGADVNVKDEDGETPLHDAAREGHKEIAKLLIDNGADVNVKDTFNKTPLHVVAEDRRWTTIWHTAIAELLITNGADVDAKTKYDNITPLHNAIRYEHTDMARELIKAGADVNAKDREWDTPLHLAAQKGNTELARLLIDKGADVNAKYKNDVNGALNQVFSYSGFSVIATEKYGSSPLHRAADYGRTALAGLLIDKGADVKAKDDMFKTPLDLAEKSGHKNTVKLLTQNGGKQDEH